jgi:uroporphyrinogen-III synthase
LLGARMRAVSRWRLQGVDVAASREALGAALDCSRIVFTSPAAVRAAAHLRALRARDGQQWFAVGAGTAAALRRAGIAAVIAPTRMDSDGLLASPDLQDVHGRDIGLVTAAGGRELIAPTLRARGARVLRANVYARIATRPSPRAINDLRALHAPAWLMLSSGAALEQLLATLPADAITALRSAHVAAASDRLARLAQSHGFSHIVTAASAMPRDLVDAAAHASWT